MKFTIVVILALAVSAQAGFLPAVVDHSHGPWSGPWDGHWDGHYSAHGWPAAYGPYGPSLTTSYHGYPGFYGAPYAHAPAPLAHGHDAKYVAANRGSVHVAPLVGHTQSVSSTNVLPAPGTTW